MLSPGFSIPSIGTPLHQPEEDQQILPHNSPLPSRQQNAATGFGLNLPHQQQTQAPTSSQALYNMPGFTPQHMLQPQTPVIIIYLVLISCCRPMIQSPVHLLLFSFNSPFILKFWTNDFLFLFLYFIDIH